MTDNDGCGVPRNRDAWTRTGLVEYVDTPDEHTDRFYRHGDWGIEEHNEHEFQVYAVVNGTPVPVKEGLMSFEECVEFIDGASKARKLNDEDCGHGDSDVKDDVKVKIVMKPFRQMMEDIAKAKYPPLVEGGDFSGSTASLGEYNSEAALPPRRIKSADGDYIEEQQTYIRYGGKNPGTGEDEFHPAPGVGGKSVKVKPLSNNPGQHMVYQDPETGEEIVRDDSHKIPQARPGATAQGFGNTGMGTNGTPALGEGYERPEFKNAVAFFDEESGQWKARQDGRVYDITDEELATMDDNGMVRIDAASQRGIDLPDIVAYYHDDPDNNMPQARRTAESRYTLQDSKYDTFEGINSNPSTASLDEEYHQKGLSNLIFKKLPEQFRNEYSRYLDLAEVSDMSTAMTALADNFARDPEMVQAVQGIMRNPSLKGYVSAMMNRATGNRQRIDPAKPPGMGDDSGNAKPSSAPAENPMDSYYRMDPRMGTLMYLLKQVVEANPKQFRGLDAATSSYIQRDKTKGAKKNVGIDNPKDKTPLYRGVNQAPGTSDQRATDKARREVEGLNQEERNQRLKDQAAAANAKDAARKDKLEEKKEEARMSDFRGRQARDAREQAAQEEKEALGEKNTSPEATAYSEGMKMFRDSMQADARMRGRDEPDDAGLDTRFINEYPREIYGVPGGKPLPPEVAERHARIMAKLERWERNREGKIPADAGQINPDEKGEYNDLAQQGIADTVNIKRSDEPVSFRKLMEEENLRKSGDQGLPMHFGDRARIEPFREFYRTVTVGSDKQDISTVVDPHRNRSD